MNISNKPTSDNTADTVFALNNLFSDGGVLSGFIIGLDDAVFQKSDRHHGIQGSQEYFMVFRDKKEIGIISIPKRGIQKDVVYDVFVKSEKEPRFRFRLGTETKVRKYNIKNNARIKSTEETSEHISGSIGEFHKEESGRSIHFSQNIHSPLHIKVSPRQTIGKREAVLSVVKAVVDKIGHHHKK